MADKLEVLPGPGLVARFGEITVWAGPQASPALQAHLVSEARNASQAANGGDQLANSFISVLQRGDPEPQAPFGLAGPGANGLTLFLHGPVQAWDSGRWLAPQPVPGWMVTAIGRPWPLIMLAYGAPPPAPSQQGNPFDLAQGVVPGSGFVLLRPADTGLSQPAASAPGLGAPQPAVPQQVPAQQVPAQQVQPTAFSQPSPSAGPSGPQPGPGALPSSQAPVAQGQAVPMSSAPPASGVFAAATAPGAATAPAAVAVPYVDPAAVPAPAPPLAPAPGGTLDLRSVAVPYRPSLPLAAEWQGPSDLSRPSVLGVNCQLGHFNHPRMTACARCGRPIPPGTPQLSGPRPPIGVLLADDGSVWSLAQGCLIGAEPAGAPEVQSGALQPIAMRAGTNHTMAPVHAEVQIREWDAYLVDRGADSGTWAQGPGEPAWKQLGRGEQRLLTGGSHVSCGGRVLTFLSSWGG